jgi:hypothetical protein
MSSSETESHIHWRPIGELLERKNHGRMGMPGFDEEFRDIVDYIIKITHRIWEQKNAGLCYEFYADHCPVHTLSGYSDSVEEVVQATLDTIAAYPDRTLIGENVVWAPHGDQGFYSSHRITSVMTNSGSSEFGPATGRTGRVTTIADCVCEGNRVVYEWLMRDNGFLVKQLGLDPVEVAKQLAKIPVHPKFQPWWDAEYERVSGLEHRVDGHPAGEPADGEAFAQNWIQRLFNLKLFGDVASFYQPNARVEWPGGRHVIGLRGITGTFIQWLAQFTGARVSCDHVGVTPFDQHCTDIAIRWTLAGRYTTRIPGLKKFNGMPALVLGGSHLRVEDGRISQEWTVFDELGLLSNLFRQAGESGA